MKTMKNLVKISAAGSGKTYGICTDALKQVNSDSKKSLIITYTNRGRDAVEKEIRKQNNGVLHSKVIIKTWFQFLFSDVIRPYQALINNNKINELRGFDFSQCYGKTNYNKKGTRSRYISKNNYIHSNQSSELAVLLNQKSNNKIITRLSEIYSNIFIDEIQDLAGCDIEFIDLLLSSQISITCCGDNKQATYSTHNTTKNKKMTGKNIWNFFQNNNVQIEKNLESRRFNEEICKFANSIFPEGDLITTSMHTKTDHDGVFLIEEGNVEKYYTLYTPQVLRYDSKTKTPYHSVNFGACKGETYDRVLIYPNSPLKKFILKNEQLKNPEKYYVAVTRPRYSIAIVLDKIPKDSNKFSFTHIKGIPVLKFKI